MANDGSSKRLYGPHGRIIDDEDMRQRMMHMRRQVAHMIKLGVPVLTELENLLEIPTDKRIDRQIRIEP